jgi:hypothetical protein
MSALWLEYGVGFAFNQNGGLSMAQGWDETRQWLERFAMTVPKLSLPDGTQTDPEYLPSPFGLGGRVIVGQLPTSQAAKQLGSLIAAAAASAPGTNPSQPPSVTITNNNDHIYVVSVTVYLSSGLTQTLSYQVS